MRKSSVRGTSTSGDVQVLGLTPHALWLLINGREYMLDHKRFPWFREVSIRQVQEVEMLGSEHLHWPSLDVDLHLDSIAEPDRFPLISGAERQKVERPRAKTKAGAGRRSKPR